MGVSAWRGVGISRVSLVKCAGACRVDVAPVCGSPCVAVGAPWHGVSAQPRRPDITPGICRRRVGADAGWGVSIGWVMCLIVCRVYVAPVVDGTRVDCGTRWVFKGRVEHRVRYDGRPG